MPFDQRQANRAVDFFEGLLTHCKGSFARKPFILPWWQKKIVQEVFGTLRLDGLRQYRTVYLEVPKKNGKALAVDTPVPTIHGWKLIGEIEIGDELFDDSGQSCRVTFATEIMHDRPCYELSFSDGSKIVADAEHRWQTKTRKPEGKTLLHTTEAISRSLRIESPGSAGSNHSISVAGPLQLPETCLPINPYIFGVWLGDGTSANASITIGDKDIELLEHITACGIRTDILKNKRLGVKTVWLGGRKRTGICNRGHDRRGKPHCLECERQIDRAKRRGLKIPPVTEFSLQEKLKALGVLRNKHIPSRYQRASIEQRTSLLQGLMDTDGYVSKAGQCEFTTVNEQLRDGVFELLCGLGFKPSLITGRARVNGKDCGPKFRIQFWAFDNRPVFRLKRKLQRQKSKPRNSTRSTTRQIETVVSVPSVPVRCLQVDSPSRLFLVGRSMIATHNTELAAGFALKLLFDDDEAGAEVYSAASTRDQAGICFRAARSMVRQCDFLDGRCNVIDSTKVIYLKDDPNSFYKAISADADVQDGINPSGAIYDELHRLKHRDLWDVLEYGTATRDQPLIVVITTAGVVGESPICEEMHDKAVQILKGTFKDPSFYAVIYGLDKDEDWTFEGEPAKFDRSGTKIIKAATGWYKANPALGDFMKVDAVRKEVADAKQIPSKQSSLKRFRFNQWVNAESTWLESDKWKLGDEPFQPNDFVGRKCYGGLDLSSTQDVTAFVLEFPWEDQYFLIPHFFLPEEGIKERARRDNVPYDIWAKQGLITLTPGDVIDYGFTRKAIKAASELYELVDIGHDPWNATQLVTELAEEDGLVLAPIRQGFASLSGPSKDWEQKVISGKVRHNGNPILAWMNDCCSIKQDAAGNIKPVKPERKASSRRVDGIVAAIMAHDRCIRHEAKAGSVYEERGLIVI